MTDMLHKWVFLFCLLRLQSLEVVFSVHAAVDQFYEAADQHLHTAVVLIDMSKAFDKVQHQTLLQDLFELTWRLPYGTGLVCGLPQRTTPVCGHCQQYTHGGNSLHVRCLPWPREACLVRFYSRSTRDVSHQ